MPLNMILTRYCRKFGTLFMFMIPILILIFMVLGNFEPGRTELNISGFFWFLLFLNSLTFSILGVSNYRNFNKEAKKKSAEGFPIESLEGFTIVTRFLKQTLTSTLLISLVIGISLILFITSISVIPTIEKLLELFPSIEEIINLTEENIRDLKNTLRIIIMFSAIGLILIAIGILLLLKLPEKPSFEVGAFLKYYNPRVTPMSLDNILSDSIYAFIDPITKMRFDEWTTSIAMKLRDDFESNEDKNLRLERAREKILLLFYLKKRMPLKMTIEHFEKELSEVLRKEEISNFLKGIESGISSTIIEEIFEKLIDNMPEIFFTIDRLIIELTDNLKAFIENHDIWVTTAAPEKITGNQNPFRILVFALNKDIDNYSNKKRQVQFHITGARSNFMEEIDYSLALDEAKDLFIPEFNLPFYSDETTDILEILTKILQIGDAVWFTVERKNFKKHLFHISIFENGRGNIFGESIKIEMVRDLMFYLKTYGGKLSALTGLILPFVSIFIPI